MTVQVLNRQQIGLWPPNYSRLAERRDKLIGVTVHWTDTGQNDPVDTWRVLQEDAIEGRNVNNTFYGDIEYNAGITDAGQILLGRANGYVGAHAFVKNTNLANRTHLGVAYVGNGTPTVAACGALLAYIYEAILSFKLPGPIQLRGHDEWEPYGGIATACPGSLLPFVQAIRNRYGLLP